MTGNNLLQNCLVNNSAPAGALISQCKPTVNTRLSEQNEEYYYSFKAYIHFAIVSWN